MLWSLVPLATLAATTHPIGPAGAHPVTGVAARGEVWAVVDAHGRVWTSGDGGERWDEALEPPEPEGSDPGRAAEVVVRLAELGPEEASEGSSAGGADEEALDALNAEVEAGAWFLDGPPAPVLPRVAFTAGGALAVTRADGLWVGGAEGWARVTSEPTTAFCDLGDRWLVGTPTGPRSAPAGGGAWSVADPAAGPVRDLACEAPTTGHAATATGVWTTEGGGWVRRLGPADATAVLALPAGVVLAASGRLWTSSSPAAAPDPVGRAPGATAVVATDAGLLLALGAAGPLSSADGGLTWTRAQGLPLGRIHAAASAGERILLATDAGLFVHDPGARGLADRAPVDPGVLVDAALRDGPRAPRGSRATALLPALDLVWIARWGGTGRPTPDPAGSAGWRWDAGLALTWAPRRAELDVVDEVDVMVVDGEVVVDDGEGRHLIAASLARDAAARRSRTARAVVELLAARRQVLGRLRQIAAAPVLERARLALRLEEIDARLDVLTDGAAGAVLGEEER